MIPLVFILALCITPVGIMAWYLLVFAACLFLILAITSVFLYLGYNLVKPLMTMTCFLLLAVYYIVVAVLSLLCSVLSVSLAVLDKLKQMSRVSFYQLFNTPIDCKILLELFRKECTTIMAIISLLSKEKVESCEKKAEKKKELRVLEKRTNKVESQRQPLIDNKIVLPLESGMTIHDCQEGFCFPIRKKKGPKRLNRKSKAYYPSCILNQSIASTSIGSF
jgi:hypothetical protein